MKVTFLGTGTPLLNPDRAGTSILIEAQEQSLLFDCGPKSLYNLLNNKTSISDINHLFFTHHHIDHNSAFFNFLIIGWMLGRRELTVAGPAGTETLVDSFYEIYEADLKYKERVTDEPLDSIRDIEVLQTTNEFQYTTDTFEITACAVDHTIETYAYKVHDRESGKTVVFSGDTGFYPPLAEFASGADLLIHDGMVAPIQDPVPDSEVLAEYEGRYPLDDADWEVFNESHSSPEQAGTIASNAGAETLVLTHIMQLRDTDQMREAAESTFDGEVIVAEDCMSIEI